MGCADLAVGLAVPIDEINNIKFHVSSKNLKTSFNNYTHGKSG
ncbi:MAG: hypothetical protein AABW63_00320 [Nanoarchaeota archaeon]